MATGNEVYQQLIADATEAFQYAERVLEKARKGRNPNGTYIAATARPHAVRAAEKQVAKAETALLAAYKTANDYDTKQKAKAERAAERERVKAELAAERERVKAERAADLEATERAKAERAAERERAKAERAAEQERAKAERAAARERAKAERAAARERAKAERAAEQERAKRAKQGQRQPEDNEPPTSEPAASAPPERSDILEKIRQRREKLGADTTLEEQVLGGEGGGGIRDVAQDFISANRNLFDPNKMSGLAAQELLEQAVNLSEDALEARDAKEASYYLVRLKSILNIAKQAKGGTADAVASQIESLIQPVVETLKKQSGFGARVKESVETYARSIPERLLAGIPVVGGLLSDIARERRESRDTESEFLGRIGKRVSRRGAKTRTGYLDFGGAFTGRRAQSSVIPFPPESSTPDAGELSSPEYGAQAESPLQGLDDMAEAIGDKGSKDPRTLVGLMALIANKLGIGGGGLMSMFGNQDGQGSGESGGLMDTAIGMVGRRGRTGRLLRTARLAPRLAGRTIASTAGKVVSGGRGLLSSIGSGLSSAFGAVSGAASRLNPLNLLSEGIRGSAKTVGKALLSAPGIGALLETAIGAMDISSTKGNPNLSPDEKKEMIGKQLVGTIGGALGSIGGGVLAGALGSVVPGAGTAIGGIVGSMGGAWLGRWLGEQLGEALGGRGIYDLVESIPGLGSLISVEDGGANPIDGEKSASNETGAVNGAGYQGSVAPTSGAGSEVGRQTMAAGAARSELANATASTPAANSSVVATNNSRTNVNNVTNNFNDDLRIRNNEPTIKAFQMGSIMPA